MAMFAKGLAAAAVRDRSDAFQLGERAGVLSHLEQAAIIPHVATAEGQKFPYEVRYLAAVSLLPGQHQSHVRMKEGCIASIISNCIQSGKNAESGR